MWTPADFFVLHSLIQLEMDHGRIEAATVFIYRHMMLYMVDPEHDRLIQFNLLGNFLF